MSITQPPVEHRQAGQDSEDVDGLLRDFFHSAMPNPWPAPPTRAQNLWPFSHHSSWKRRSRSVLALAASLVIVAVTLFLLPCKFNDRSPAGFLHEGPSGKRDQPYKDSLPHGQIRPENK